MGIYYIPSYNPLEGIFLVYLDRRDVRERLFCCNCIGTWGPTIVLIEEPRLLLSESLANVIAYE